MLDDEGYVHRGSRLTELARDAAEPPEWRLRDFAFAAYSGPNAPGLRQVHFGRKSLWAFAAAREHTEEGAWLPGWFNSQCHANFMHLNAFNIV